MTRFKALVSRVRELGLHTVEADDRWDREKYAICVDTYTRIKGEQPIHLTEEEESAGITMDTVMDARLAAAEKAYDAFMKTEEANVEKGAREVTVAEASTLMLQWIAAIKTYKANATDDNTLKRAINDCVQAIRTLKKEILDKRPADEIIDVMPYQEKFDAAKAIYEDGKQEKKAASTSKPRRKCGDCDMVRVVYENDACWECWATDAVTRMAEEMSDRMDLIRKTPAYKALLDDFNRYTEMTQEVVDKQPKMNKKLYKDMCAVAKRVFDNMPAVEEEPSYTGEEDQEEEDLDEDDLEEEQEEEEEDSFGDGITTRLKRLEMAVFGRKRGAYCLLDNQNNTISATKYSSYKRARKEADARDNAQVVFLF